MSDIPFSTARPARTAPRLRLAAAVRAWARAIRRAHRIRVTVGRLRGLSDHTLRDIGLERGDIDPAGVETALRSRQHARLR